MTEENVNTVVKIFSNSEFGQIRVITKDNEVWFVGKDVADILGYDQTANMLKRLDDNEKADHPIWNIGVNQNRIQVVINESGLYNAIFGSILPEAKKFKKWVTSEVLPSIRKHGAYIQPETLEEMIMSPEFGIRLLQEIKSERVAKQKALEERDKAIKEKCWIADKKTATALANSGHKTRQLNKVVQEKQVLQQRLNEAVGYATIATVQKQVKNLKVNYTDLKASCKKLGVKALKVVDKRYGAVNSYPAVAWNDCYKIDIAEIVGSLVGGVA